MDFSSISRIPLRQLATLAGSMRYVVHISGQYPQGTLRWDICIISNLVFLVLTESSLPYLEVLLLQTQFRCVLHRVCAVLACWVRHPCTVTFHGCARHKVYYVLLTLESSSIPACVAPAVALTTFKHNHNQLYF